MGDPRRERHLRAGTVAIVLAIAAGGFAIPATSAAAEPDPFTLFLDGAGGILEAQSAPRVCPELTMGTAGLPEAGPPDATLGDGNGLNPGDPTSAPASLPRNVYLRTTRETYNRRYWFALRGGHIYYKANAEVTGMKQPWAPLATPACFDGRVTGISVDDDELVALALHRQAFTMDGALGDRETFNWTVRWGPLFWTGAGRRIPKGSAWAWSVSSPREDGTFTDPAGNQHPVGSAKVSHVWLLNHKRRRLTYMDPWLPADRSFEMCSPHRGRFRSAAMSASGSTVFIIGRRGDMYTRLFDFDISGPDSLFVTYSYADQRGVGNPAVQLPPERWKRQPKIRGAITNRISIEKVGAGSTHRTLRVAGRRRGKRGYFQRDSAAPRKAGWRFVRTGRRPSGGKLRNPRRDSSRFRLARSENRRYVMKADGLRASIPNFNAYCSPARLRVRLANGRAVKLKLHTTDAIRQSPRGRGLDDQPRIIQGTVQAPRKVLDSRNTGVKAFVAKYLTGGRFTAARIDGTRKALSFPQQSWTFTRARH